jgi:hypothetical protein
MSQIKKIAIFNSFHFHYEMFGYIIHYCKKNNYELTIFTEMMYDYSWLDFYTKNNDDFLFTIKHYNIFESERELFDIVFIITDDDPRFKNEWVNQKTICIDHHFSNRRTSALHHIATRPFKENLRRWSLPCFPLVNLARKLSNIEKLQNDSVIHIAIIGGTHSLKNTYNVQVINRLKIENNRIQIHAISRNINEHMFLGLRPDIELKIYNNSNTFDMLYVLEKCSYLLTDVDCNSDHANGYSMSGGIPMAFSNLLPLIISKENNSIYNFKNVVEFEMNEVNNIILSNSLDKFEGVSKEREDLIKMFHSNMYDIICK